MRVDIADQYWQAVTVIEAQAMLSAMTISDYPHLKSHARKKVHRDLHRMAFPRTWNGEKITLDEFLDRHGGKLDG